MFLLKIKRKG